MHDLPSKINPPATAQVLPHPQAMLQAQLSYAKVGIRTFPVDSASKEPSIKGWQRKATCSEDTIREWHRKWPDLLIGMPTDRVAVIDLDVKSGKDGPAELRNLEAVHGAIPMPLLQAATPSGGVHLYFKRPHGVSLFNRCSDIAPGIDTRTSRADGSKAGFVVLPPSQGRNGGRYEYNTPLEHWPFLWGADLSKLPEPPDWLLFRMIFTARDRTWLAGLGITGPKAFNMMSFPPAQWELWATAARRAANRKQHGYLPSGPLAADIAGPLIKYVRAGVKGECDNIRNAQLTKRDSTVNIAGCKIWSLLHAIGEWVDPEQQAALIAEAHKHFLEAADTLGIDEKDGPFIDIAAEKWERCCDAADDSGARKLADVAAGKATAEQDFGDIIDKLLEYPGDISLDGIKKRQASALIKGHILPGEMGMLYAKTTAGKTFIALYVAWLIALGRELHGMRVRQAPVLYVALEGVLGLRKRMLACKAELGDPGKQLSRLAVHVSLVRGQAGKHGAELIVKAAQTLAAEAGRPVGFIVIDTLARAMAGDDENDTGDMMHFIEQRAGHIARATGAAMLIVHHPNKSGDARGSSSAPAGFDFIWRIDLHGNRRTLVAEKVKDGAEGPMFDFQLRPVLLGADDDGDPIDTCIVQPAQASPAPVKPVTVLKHIKVFHDAFDAALEAGHAVEGRVDLAAVREAFMDRYTVADAEPVKAQKTKERKWRLAFDQLDAEYESGEIGGIVRVWRRAFQGVQ